MFDVVIVGGGVIGCATARSLLRDNPHLNICLLEKEPALAVHQSGRNSGVVHVGYNQKPGTLKARFVVEGSRRLRDYCTARGISIQQKGILIVAQSENEIPVIEELQRRGQENGVAVRLVDRDFIREREPHTIARAALFAPDGASFDSKSYVEALGNDARQQGAQIRLGEPVIGLDEKESHVEIRVPSGVLKSRVLVNAAGLHADRLAHRLAVGLGYAVIPFRGDYYELVPHKRYLVNSHIYPAPDLNFPFLGIHFSRSFHDHVKIGPSSTLVLGREGYRGLGLHGPDLAAMLGTAGFWNMVLSKTFRELVRREWKRSFMKKAFFTAAQKLIPALTIDDLVPGPSGIRAQLVSRTGSLVDDIAVEGTPRTVHVLNAVSPALTCSLPFGDYIRSQVVQKL